MDPGRKVTVLVEGRERQCISLIVHHTNQSWNARDCNPFYHSSPIDSAISAGTRRHLVV